jgi:hypothetical protein
MEAPRALRRQSAQRKSEDIETPRRRDAEKVLRFLCVSAPLRLFVPGLLCDL